MSTFNSYVVFDKEGGLIAHDNTGGENSPIEPVSYFKSLSADIQHRAHIMFVLQEHSFIARYTVVQPTVPLPILGPREPLGA